MIPEKFYALRIRLGSLEKYPDLGNVDDLNETAQARAYSEAMLQMDQTGFFSAADSDEMHILRYNLFFVEDIMTMAVGDKVYEHMHKLQLGVKEHASAGEKLRNAGLAATYLDLLHGSRVAIAHLETGFSRQSSAPEPTPQPGKPEDLFNDESIRQFARRFTRPEVVRGELFEAGQRVDHTLGKLTNRLRSETATGLILPCQTRSTVILGVEMTKDILLSMRDRTEIANEQSVPSQLWIRRN